MGNERREYSASHGTAELGCLKLFFVWLQVEAVTVCLMNAYVNGVHERQIRDVLTKEMPNVPVSISSEVLPEMYEYERALTTVRAGLFLGSSGLDFQY